MHLWTVSKEDGHIKRFKPKLSTQILALEREKAAVLGVQTPNSFSIFWTEVEKAVISRLHELNFGAEPCENNKLRTILLTTSTEPGSQIQIYSGGNYMDHSNPLPSDPYPLHHPERAE